MPGDDLARVTLRPGGSDQDARLSAPAGASLAQALFLEGYFTGRALCSGLGRCGLCRVRFQSPPPEPTASERRKLGPDKLAKGWRLACQHPAQPAELLIPASAKARGLLPEGAPSQVVPGLLLAVDLGTTGLEWLAVLDGREIARGRDVNPQMGAGAEVVSRLAFAAHDGGFLRALALDYLRGVVSVLPGLPQRMCLAGNPAMTLILLGRDLAGLSRAPYRLAYAAGETVRLAGDLPEAYFAPLLGPFVGGDASAGLIHLCLSRTPADYPFLLADLGTNGEFVLALSPGEFLAASAPMGPALEGSGLTHGTVAGPGCAVAFEASSGGLVPVLFEGSRQWSGQVSGTGYLSLIAALSRLGLIGEDGRFLWPWPAAIAALAARLGAVWVTDGPEAGLGLGAMTLWASDLEETLKVKAACNAVFSRLLVTAGLAPGELVHLDLAGALGYHARLPDLERLGFIPPGAARAARRAGNTSLAGAMDLLADSRARDMAAGLGRQVRVLDMASDPGFQKEYLDRMVFRYVR
jgi:uncharacterized 2Fe-2S/4Fe-4S cluster protein (DUF4445 family)